MRSPPDFYLDARTTSLKPDRPQKINFTVYITFSPIDAPILDTLLRWPPFCLKNAYGLPFQNPLKQPSGSYNSYELLRKGSRNEFQCTNL